MWGRRAGVLGLAAGVPGLAQGAPGRRRGILPDATLTTIEGAGHVVHQTRPTEFLAALDVHLGT